jgi:BolA family transcriptional regulator, general stress-responsive regulator
MDLIKSIEARVYSALNVISINIVNESENHADHYSISALPSHIKLIIVSDDFIDMDSLKRHRLIHRLLENEIKLLHAISLYLYTNDEYNNF